MRGSPATTEPGTEWPTGELPDPQAQALLAALVDAVLDDPEVPGTLAELVVHRGTLVAERYQGTVHLPDATWGDPEVPVGPTTPLLSWSMAKSITHALIGLLVNDGLIDTAAATGFECWQDDERAAITVEHLLRMSDGLAWSEDYVDAGTSDVIEMLFGAGRADAVAYVLERPLAATPGRRWVYSSGTTNLLCALAQRALGDRRVADYLRERLFEPIGMSSATTRTDEAGTFLGSSFVHATARDYARFGLLYLRGGTWRGERILPSSWVEHALTPTPGVDSDDGVGFGAHWWLWNPEWGHAGTFACHGYHGQRILCDPTTDTIVVRLGATPVEHGPALRRHLIRVLDAVGAERAHPRQT